jgi:hypothetical protein
MLSRINRDSLKLVNGVKQPRAEGRTRLQAMRENGLSYV